MPKLQADPNQRPRRGQYRGAIWLNRSRKWRYAQTYLQAREQSPSSRLVDQRRSGL